MSRLCQDSNKDVALTSVKDNDFIPVRHDRSGSGDDDYNVPKSVMQCEPVGTCTTVAATAAKTVTLDNDSFPDFVLRKGRSILVEFTNANTANAPTLNVNGTGAYPIACIGGTAQVGSGCWTAGATMEFTFSGTKWLMHSNIVAQDNNVSTGYTSYADGTTGYSAAQVNGALTNYVNSKLLEGGTYTINEFVNLLISQQNVTTVKKYIFDPSYGNRICIKDFLGGTTQYDFISGDVTVTRYSTGQFSLIFNINTYYIGSNRYFENLLVEYSFTGTGNYIWTKYTTNNDLDSYKKTAAYTREVVKTNQQYAKLEMRLLSAYTTTMIALHSRGGALCLLGVSYQDSGNAAVVSYLKNNGVYGSTMQQFYYKATDLNRVELYWRTTAYSNKENFTIITNVENSQILTVDHVGTLPSDCIAL